MFTPAYLNLLRNGELEQRVSQAQKMLESCNYCGCYCRVNRFQGGSGVCRTGVQASLSSYGPHMGEEDPLRGWLGSGTIFFTRCNLRCQYCQNHDISQTDSGHPVTPNELAAAMLDLQTKGCHNINLVSPTHVVAPIIEAVFLAAQKGLMLPMVYNTGGYDSLEALALLDGIIDIYMPDMKYANQQTAHRYSKIPRYPQVNQAAVLEMHRQVGDLRLDDRGIALRGLIVRHLVLPKNLAGTAEIVDFIAQKISPNTYINIMDQYHPAYRAKEYPSLKNPVTVAEVRYAFDIATQAGLRRFA